MGFLRSHPRSGRVLIAVVILLLLDLGAGLVFIPRQYDTFRGPHPEYHHGFEPGAAGNGSWKGSVTDYRINSLGFRDRAVRRVLLQPGRERTLLLGDGNTEGRGVPFSQTFAGILADSLGKHGHDVMNAGGAGYSPLLHYLRTRYLIKKENLAFDNLVCLIDFSDVQDEVIYASFQPDPERSDDFRWYRIKNMLQSRLLSWHLIGGTEEPDAITPGQYCTVFPEMQAGLNRWTQATRLAQRGHWTEKGRITTDWGIGGLDLAFRNMKRLADLCRAHKIRMSIAVYPWPRQITSGAPDCLHRKAWRGFAEQEGLAFIDLYPLFINDRPAAEVVDEYFIRDDVHWNAAGHAAVAAELLGHFRKQ